MIIMAFDLSSACIGVVTARLKNEEVEKIMSCPIIPNKFSPAVLGYQSSKKKLKTKTGEEINTYWKIGETSISKTEKKKRDMEVRKKKDIYVLENIGERMGNIIKEVRPDLILVEKNSIFNGILTSILLAKVYGTLLGIAGMFQIPVEEYSVQEVRSILSPARLVFDFTRSKTEAELNKIPDVTKAVIRELLYEEYKSKGIEFQSDDESDAAAVFHYWFKKRSNING